MALKSTVISSFAKFILGSGTFDRIKDIVQRQNDKTISGTEKRYYAYEEIKMLGIGIATWMVNLAIELAVAYFRTVAEKDTNK